MRIPKCPPIRRASRSSATRPLPPATPSSTALIRCVAEAFRLQGGDVEAIGIGRAIEAVEVDLGGKAGREEPEQAREQEGRGEGAAAAAARPAARRGRRSRFRAWCLTVMSTAAGKAAPSGDQRSRISMAFSPQASQKRTANGLVDRTERRSRDQPGLVGEAGVPNPPGGGPFQEIKSSMPPSRIHTPFLFSNFKIIELP